MKKKILVLYIAIIISITSTPFISIGADEDNFDNQSDEWYKKPGYTNCTWGVPDFDMHLDDWKAMGYRGIEQWYMDGPIALLDCLWWLDCKYHDVSGEPYFLPDLCGKGSKHPDNVEPLAEWLAFNALNTTLPLPGPFKCGTTAENFTKGINDLLEYFNLTDYLSLDVIGYRDNWEIPNYVNYSNITDALDNCSDVIALLGFWYFNWTSVIWERIGGHYVQINGYNKTNTSLSFSDPYIDWAEQGGYGWYSPHTTPHRPQSHNDTNNVSYDYWNLTLSPSPGGELMVWEYPIRSDRDPFEFWNWTYMNWWDDCPHGDWPDDTIYTEIEMIWSIQGEYNIEVNKTVWNGTHWVKWYNATVGETLTFNVTMWNIGKNITSNVTVWDTFYDALGEYVDGSSYITWPNGTRTEREADWWSREGGGCDYSSHGHIRYDLCDNFDYWGTGESITIHFNITVNNTNFSINNVTIYVCEEPFCGVECIGVDLVNQSSECYINQEFNTSINCTKNCFSDKSDWTVSEHVHRECTASPCLDEIWFEYETEFDRWAPYNTSTWLDEDWGWVYSYDNWDGLGTDSMNLSYTIANNSCANRSQNVLRMRINFSEGPGLEDWYDPFIGVIYSYSNNSWYDMVLYGYFMEFMGDSYPIVSCVSKRYDTLVNSYDGSVIDGPQHLINYWNENWSCNQTQHELDLYMFSGIWSKINYKDYCGHLQVKAWDVPLFGGTGLCNEPSGWIYEGNLPNSIYENETCFGLVVWNPNGTNFTADFDFIDEWRLNYSYDGHANQSQIENHTLDFVEGIPLMEFDALNFGEDIYMETENWVGYCFNEFMVGNLTFQEFVDCTSCKDRNISSHFGMTSRLVYAHNLSCTEPYSWDNQNDTVYYYTAIMTNITALGIDSENVLVVHIEDASDGTEDELDGAMVAIDIDNNMQWDNNDICFLWYDDGMGFVDFTIWNGTNIFDNETLEISEAFFNVEYTNCSSYYSGQSLISPLHRYSNHRIYEAYIPLDYLEKRYVGSSWYLDAGDTFGINAMTIPYNMFSAVFPAVDLPHPWSNWNETNCTHDDPYYTTPEDLPLLTWDFFMNVTTAGALDDLYFDGIWNGTNSFHMQNWGHGRIGSQEGPLFEYEMHINKTANVSEVTNISQYNHVNYTIRVCNYGFYNVTNVVVRDIIPEGSTYINSSLPEVNVTGSDRNWTFNLTHFLHHSGDCIEFNITVNFSAGMAPNGTTVYNYVNVTTLQGANASNISGVKYGDNTPPVIKWQYPANGSLAVSLLLTNMSVGVGDIDGSFDVYFYTNKTHTWNSGWNALGSNLTQTNGTFQCNQTFNNSQWYNTRWRWGTTTYYWTINVTDGLVWVNESYWYTTDNSRYDVTTSGDVVSADVSVCWVHRQGQASYDGIYDVTESGDVVSADVSAIWEHRT